MLRRPSCFVLGCSALHAHLQQTRTANDELGASQADVRMERLGQRGLGNIAFPLCTGGEVWVI